MRDQSHNYGHLGQINLDGITQNQINFGLLLNTYLRIDDKGVYTFKLKGGDGVRMIIDDEILIEHDGIHGMDLNVEEIALADGYHKIIIEYF